MVVKILVMAILTSFIVSVVITYMMMHAFFKKLRKIDDEYRRQIGRRSRRHC